MTKVFSDDEGFLVPLAICANLRESAGDFLLARLSAGRKGYARL